MKTLFIACAAFILAVGCKKEITALDPATETGANTFGAKIDGRLWAPQGFGIVPTAPLVQGRPSADNSFIIQARNFASSPTESEFEIFLKNVTGPGTYLLHSNTGVVPSASGSYGYYTERRINPKNQWITTPEFTGKVIVTRLDIPNKVISGTFEFRAKDIYADAPPITVTEGRFDLKIE
jgi:hypothetical protein